MGIEFGPIDVIPPETPEDIIASHMQRHNHHDPSPPNPPHLLRKARMQSRPVRLRILLFIGVSCSPAAKTKWAVASSCLCRPEPLQTFSACVIDGPWECMGAEPDPANSFETCSEL